MADKEKHIPSRRCIGCRCSYPKGQLVRIVKYQGNIFVDTTGKADGRGAYFCGNAHCLKTAIKGRKLEKAFRMQIPAEIYNTLEELSSNMEVH